MKTQAKINSDNSATISNNKYSFRVAIDDGELCVWDEKLQCLNVRVDDDQKEVYISTAN